MNLLMQIQEPAWAWLINIFTFLAIVFGVLSGLALLKAALANLSRDVREALNKIDTIDTRVTRLEVRCTMRHLNDDPEEEGAG